MHSHEVILVAEDNDDHVMLLRRAFLQANFLNPLIVVTDGDQVIDYLTGKGHFTNRDEYPLPTLLLLDLKMPRKNGFEVLEWIRQQPGLKALRVVVLTGSEDIMDVTRAYSLGANSFLVKPVKFSDFVELSSTIKGYWVWSCKAPELQSPDEKPERL